MPEARLPRIMVLGTGGTIAGVQRDHRSDAYEAGAVGIDDLLRAVPQLTELALIQAEQIANIGSQHISYDVWMRLAWRIAELQGDDRIDGIVVTHGTDTLEETAYFLSLVLAVGKPVVLTGAMRPSTAPGADGPANLLGAIRVAATPAAAGRGPLVFFNDEIHGARDVQKMDCNRVNAFVSPNRGPLGRLRGDGVVFYAPASAPTRVMSATLLEDLHGGLCEVWPSVEIIHAYAGMDARLVDAAASYCDGIVLAGLGAGQGNADTIAALQRALARGVPVVRSTRCSQGSVLSLAGEPDGVGQFIAARDLGPVKSRVLLMLLLAQGVSVTELESVYAQA